MSISEGTAATGFQVAFKLSGLGTGGEGGIALEGPRTKLRSMRDVASVMSSKPSAKVIRQANVPLIRVGITPQQINIKHTKESQRGLASRSRKAAKAGGGGGSRIATTD